MEAELEQAIAIIARCIDKFLPAELWWQALLDARPPTITPQRWLAYLKSKGFPDQVA